jgi:hypothetical protein
MQKQKRKQYTAEFKEKALEKNIARKPERIFITNILNGICHPCRLFRIFDDG